MSCSGTCQGVGQGGGKGDRGWLQQLHFGLCCVFVTLSECFVVLSARAALQETLFISSHDSKAGGNMNKGPTGRMRVLCVCVRVSLCLSVCWAYHNVAGSAWLSYQPSQVPSLSHPLSQAPVQFNQHYFCLNQLQLITFLLS